MKKEFLVWACALAVGAFAGESTTNELSVAREALRDGLWSVARDHARKAGDTVESRLVQLESWAAEGKWNDVARAVTNTWAAATGAAFDYYRAVVRGDHDAAAKILASEKSPVGVVQARLYEADVLARDGKSDAANAIWRDLCAQTNVSPRVFAKAAANLMDADLMRRALKVAASASERRDLSLRLGRVLLKSVGTASEGAELIRAVVRDSPDAEGARDAFLDVADAELAAKNWQKAKELYAEALETWPDAAKLASVQEGLGWTHAKLGNPTNALAAFRLAEACAKTDAARANAALEQGDALTSLGRLDEAMARYRDVAEKYPDTPGAARVVGVLKVRELEMRGRELFRGYRFAEAREVFEQVAADDPSRAPRMKFFEAICLYGNGEDDRAESLAETYLTVCDDPRVRSDLRLWLAKLKFNRRDWNGAGALFLAASKASETPAAARDDALLWSARAEFADGDYSSAIQLTTRLVDRNPAPALRLAALLLQGETLIELARFDEAVLVFDRVAATGDAAAADRLRAQILKADALFAMGADNAARYTAALEAYRAILFGGDLSPSEKIVVSFKVARALEKLRRVDEALDQYYVQVVLAYRRERKANTRLDDDARAAFSKAAFHLADEYEGRGLERQALAVLDLVATSDAPAAKEARRRMERLAAKGGNQ